MTGFGVSSIRCALVAALTACSIFSGFARAESSADTYQRDYDRYLAEFRSDQASAKEQMNAAISKRDAEARSSATCTDMDSARKTQATAYIERHQVPDPSKVIQNSTCFSDIIDIKIPVSLTGIGWLDGVISKIASKFVQGACSKVTSYVNDLKNSAINQISSGVKGALNIGQLNIAGTNVGGAVNGAINNQVDTALNGAVGQIGGAIQDSGALMTSPSYSTTAGASSAGLARAKADYAQVQCSVSGVGSNASCACPDASTLAGGIQSQYPQCTSTYVPWYGGS